MAPVLDARAANGLYRRSIADHSRPIRSPHGHPHCIRGALTMSESQQQIGAVGHLTAPHRRTELGQRFAPIVTIGLS